MKIGIYSCVNSLLFSTFILFIIRYIRRSYSFRRLSDVTFVILLYGLGFARLLLPLDFRFTKNINLEGFYSHLLDFLLYNKWTVFSLELSFIHIAGVVLLLVSIIKTILYIRRYLSAVRLLNHCKTYPSSQTDNALQELQKIYPNLRVYPVLICNHARVPVVTGILQPRIVLPDSSYSDSELFYILLHEFRHIQNHDMAKKLLIDIFCCFFWWLPCISFFRKDAVQLMEIRCDTDILKSASNFTRAEYMNTMLTCLKRTAQSNAPSHPLVLGFALQEVPHSMVERFHLMTVKYQKTLGSRQLLVLGGILSLLAISYLYVPVPVYEPPMSDILADGGEPVLPENSRIISEQGTYYLIFKNDRYPIDETVLAHMLESGFQLEVNQK